MNFYFDPAAEEEASSAHAWYEEQRKGVGNRFLTLVKESVRKITADPYRFARVETWTETDTIRRVLLQRFPYQIIYEVAVNKIHILAIAHTSREPGYWKHRRFQ